MPKSITLVEGKEISYPFYSFVNIAFGEDSNIRAVGSNLISPNVGKEKAVLRLFGRLPIKTIDVNVVSDSVVLAGGETIGVKLKTNGLTVVTFEKFTTREYKVAKPYEDKNIRRGDIITKINDVDVIDVSNFIKEIQSSNGKSVKLTFIRNGNLIEENIMPEVDRNDGKYKLGMWVKNVTSGVGTVTYINPTTRAFGALGHGISDNDMELINIESGEAYYAVILSVSKGLKGMPGELKGAIRQNNVYGEVIRNTKYGIFGYLDKEANVTDKEIEICLKNDIKVGKAKILCTVSGDEVKEYDIEIERIALTGENNSRNMIIRITDKELLDKTGGIVQGMSGSPIIQNGKLIGAVTHVLINDPTRGYGVFIENMLESENS